MGRAAKERPTKLAAKLQQIREALALSQNELLQQLEDASSLSQRSISKFELGLAEPPLKVLLAYATLANVFVDVLIDDELELPATLPSPTKHEGIKRSKRLSKAKN